MGRVRPVCLDPGGIHISSGRDRSSVLKLQRVRRQDSGGGQGNSAVLKQAGPALPSCCCVTQLRVSPVLSLPICQTGERLC